MRKLCTKPRQRWDSKLGSRMLTQTDKQTNQTETQKPNKNIRNMCLMIHAFTPGTEFGGKSHVFEDVQMGSMDVQKFRCLQSLTCQKVCSKPLADSVSATVYVRTAWKKVTGLPQDEVAGVAEHERWLPGASDRHARLNSGLSPRLIHWSLVSRQ